LVAELVTHPIYQEIAALYAKHRLKDKKDTVITFEAKL
jgi:hypothetical protein